MKFALFLAGGLLLAVPAFAQQMNFNIPGMNQQQQDALMQMMGPAMEAENKVEACLKQRLGDDAMKREQVIGKQMNAEIVPLCKQGKITEAHDVAERYAATPEGQAAMDCGHEIQPLLDDPRSAKVLGRYAPMATELAGGHVPADVCTGLKK